MGYPTDADETETIPRKSFENELQALREQGLGFGDCVRFFGEAADKSPYILAAMDDHASEGELEVDDHAVVSVGEDDGAYVSAWLWITDDEAGVVRPSEANLDEPTCHRSS